MLVRTADAPPEIHVSLAEKDEDPENDDAEAPPDPEASAEKPSKATVSDKEWYQLCDWAGMLRPLLYFAER